MDAGSSATASTSNRQKRVLPSRSRRGGPGLGACEVDNTILDTQRRKAETDPVIPANTKFLLATNPKYAVDCTTVAPGISISFVKNERYFNRPEVIKSCRDQTDIEIPSFETIPDSASLVGGRFRPRGQEDESAETSDAAFEKRHRKFETFEKRQRLREKEKLKHEHYKLKERIEQLRAMDGVAFMSLPASSFCPKPPNFPTEPDESPQDPGPYGTIYHPEGERRRREMLDIAAKLEQRYAHLLPSDRVRKAPDVSAAASSSKRDTEIREDGDSDLEPMPASPAPNARSNALSSKIRLPSLKSSASNTPAQSPAPSKGTAPKKQKAPTGKPLGRPPRNSQSSAGQTVILPPLDPSSFQSSSFIEVDKAAPEPSQSRDTPPPLPPVLQVLLNRVHLHNEEARQEARRAQGHVVPPPPPHSPSPLSPTPPLPTDPPRPPSPVPQPISRVVPKLKVVNGATAKKGAVAVEAAPGVPPVKKKRGRPKNPPPPPAPPAPPRVPTPPAAIQHHHNEDGESEKADSDVEQEQRRDEAPLPQVAKPQAVVAPEASVKSPEVIEDVDGEKDMDIEDDEDDTVAEAIREQRTREQQTVPTEPVLAEPMPVEPIPAEHMPAEPIVVESEPPVPATTEAQEQIQEAPPEVPPAAVVEEQDTISSRPVKRRRKQKDQDLAHAESAIHSTSTRPAHAHGESSSVPAHAGTGGSALPLTAPFVHQRKLGKIPSMEFKSPDTGIKMLTYSLLFMAAVRFQASGGRRDKRGNQSFGTRTLDFKEEYDYELPYELLYPGEQEGAGGQGVGPVFLSDDLKKTLEKQGERLRKGIDGHGGAESEDEEEGEDRDDEDGDVNIEDDSAQSAAVHESAPNGLEKGGAKAVDDGDETEDDEDITSMMREPAITESAVRDEPMTVESVSYARSSAYLPSRDRETATAPHKGKEKERQKEPTPTPTPEPEEDRDQSQRLSEAVDMDIELDEHESTTPPRSEHEDAGVRPRDLTHQSTEADEEELEW